MNSEACPYFIYYSTPTHTISIRSRDTNRMFRTLVAREVGNKDGSNIHLRFSNKHCGYAVEIGKGIMGGIAGR